jgi:hypothetical protein
LPKFYRSKRKWIRRLKKIISFLMLNITIIKVVLRLTV